MSKPFQRCSINHDYWMAYIAYGGVWRRFSQEQREAILAMPILTHERSGFHHGEPSLAHLEQRPEIRKLLQSIDCNPQSPAMHALIRLMQVCHAAGDVFAPGRNLDELCAHLVRDVLQREAVDEFRIQPVGRHIGSTLGDALLESPRFASRGRLRSFLAIKPGETGTRWENEQRQRSSSHVALVQFSGKVVCESARDILTRLIDARGPVSLASLLENPGFEPKRRSLFAKALRGLCQYVFTIAAYDPDQADLIIGLWPSLIERLDDAPAPPPPPFAAKPPATTYVAPFICADMEQIIVYASSKPIRLKSQSGLDLYAAEKKKIAADLEEVPSWVGQGMFEGIVRAPVAAFGAWTFGWLKLDREETKFVANPKGREWLALPPAERHQTLLDRLRAARWYSNQRSASGLNFTVTTGRVRHTASVSDILPCEDEIAAAFRHAPVDEWVDTKAWLDHAARAHNPIAAAVGADTIVVVPRPDKWRNITWTKREAGLLEDEARIMLHDFLDKRLVPLGCAELGRGKGKNTFFRLNEIGRYYIGATRKFPKAGVAGNGRVIVQPNFEVMILGHNLIAEADLAPFCERTGEGAGAAFRITRQSIQQALHKGAGIDDILATLRSLSDRQLPANVVTEIGGWAESRKHYHTRAATLLHCPDATVAARIHGMLPKITVPLTDNILELTAPISAPQLRKLEAAGIFQQQDTSQTMPTPKSTPLRKHRGGWYR